MMTKTRAIIQVPIIVSLLLVALTCFKWALADIYATQVNYIIDKEDDAVTDANIKVWQRAKNQLQDTLSLRPNNAQYLELAESFYQTLHTLETDAPELITALSWQDNETTALHYAEQALLLRPSWPYLWKALAVSKIALQQYDHELATAIQRASTLGPWQQSIQYQIAMLGLDEWNELQDETKLIITKAIEQSIAMNQVHAYRNKLRELLGHDSFVNVCTYLNIVNRSVYPWLNIQCLKSI